MGLFDQFKSLLDTKLNVDQRYEMVREAVSGTMSAFRAARDKKTGEVVGLKIPGPREDRLLRGSVQGAQ